MDKWSFEYEEHGGYDCMSSAYVVKAGDKFLFAIDVSNFVDKRDWGAKNTENEEAEALARLIVDSVNGRLS